MKFEALPSREWKKRMYLLLLFSFGMGGYFFYDGYIGYPKANERAHAFLEHKEGKDGKKLSEWPAFAASRGWVEKDPGEPKTEKDLRDQKIWGTGCCVLGVLVAGCFFYMKRFKITADENQIYPPRGEPVRFDAITGFDMRKWDKKGIAIANYTKSGRSMKLVLDDWKYAGAEQILREAQTRLAGAGADEQAPS